MLANLISINVILNIQSHLYKNIIRNILSKVFTQLYTSTLKMFIASYLWANETIPMYFVTQSLWICKIYVFFILLYWDYVQKYLSLFITGYM